MCKEQEISIDLFVLGIIIKKNIKIYKFFANFVSCFTSTIRNMKILITLIIAIATTISLNAKGSLKLNTNNIDEIVKEHTRLVIPGFYGALPNGDIRIMSRGGGDVSGSILANVIDADIYENWTDVSGILKADPRIVKNPKRIDVINYSELRELSYMGASVLHEEAIFPVKEKNIPIHILNTNKPDKKGTIIVESINNDNDPNVLTGIAGKKDFTILTIKKSHMSNEIGLIKKALDVFDRFRISIEHIPSGIDSFSIIVESAPIKSILYDIIEADDDDAHSKIALKDDIKLLYNKLESILSPRERLVLKMRYGLYNQEEYTQREIASRLGISRSYVSRIEKSAIEKLREHF